MIWANHYNSETWIKFIFVGGYSLSFHHHLRNYQPGWFHGREEICLSMKTLANIQNPHVTFHEILIGSSRDPTVHGLLAGA